MIADLTQLPRRLQVKIVVAPSGCWEWVGYRDPKGYGRSWDSERRRTALAHRLVWTLLRGPIPPGLVMDHVCRNHACVRPEPEHLRVCTNRENLLAPGSCAPLALMATHTHCPHGHLIDGLSSGRRYCKTCARARTRARTALYGTSRLMHLERTCAVCGAPFNPWKSTTLTCSRSCGWQLRRQEAASA